MEEKKILEVKNLSTRPLENRFRLEEIEFYLREGEVLGIIGENGAGKTTLLRTMLGLRGREQGEVSILGYRLGSQDKEWKEVVGFVSTEVIEGVAGKGIAVAKNLGGYYRDFSLEDFQKYCRLFQVNTKNRVEHLSTGEKILFFLAFSLARKPKLLILDEPFSNLDPITRENVVEVLRESLEAGDMAMIYATHLMSELEQLADRILYLEEGRQKLFADVNELQDTYFAGRKMNLEELFEKVGKDVIKSNGIPSNLNADSTFDTVTKLTIKNGKGDGI